MNQSHSQELREHWLWQLSQGSGCEAWGGQVPVDALWSGPPPSPSPTADPPGPSGQPGLASYSNPVQDDAWHSPSQPPSSSSQLPDLAAMPRPTPGQRMVPWNPMLTAIAVAQLAQLTSLPPRDDDENSYPSEEGAVKQCYRKADHNNNPPPGPVKVRFTSVNYQGTRNVRVCEKCWNWMKRPSSGMKVILRGSSRLEASAVQQSAAIRCPAISH